MIRPPVLPIRQVFEDQCGCEPEIDLGQPCDKDGYDIGSPDLVKSPAVLIGEEMANARSHVLLAKGSEVLVEHLFESRQQLGRAQAADGTGQLAKVVARRRFYGQEFVGEILEDRDQRASLIFGDRYFGLAVARPVSSEKVRHHSDFPRCPKRSARNHSCGERAWACGGNQAHKRCTAVEILLGGLMAALESAADREIFVEKSGGSRRPDQRGAGLRDVSRRRRVEQGVNDQAVVDLHGAPPQHIIETEGNFKPCFKTLHQTFEDASGLGAKSRRHDMARMLVTRLEGWIGDRAGHHVRQIIGDLRGLSELCQRV